MDSDMEEMFISLVTDLTFLASSTDWNSEVLSLFAQLISAFTSEDVDYSKILDLGDQINSHNPKVEFRSLIYQITMLFNPGLLNSEWRGVVSLIVQIIFLVSSMDLDSESELILIIKQMVSLFNSKPDSETELVSLITQTMHLGISVEATQESELASLISQLVSLKPEPELTSLIRRIISRFISMTWESLPMISFCPLLEVRLQGEKFHLKIKDVKPKETKKGECDVTATIFMRSTTENHFYCGDCNGKNHEEYDKGPVEVKHHLHPKHSLKLVLLHVLGGTRKCYCCEKDLGKIFYYCFACDYAMNLDCVKKPPPALSTDHPKWHEHPLAPFPSQTSLPCNLCAISHPSCLFYICPPCDFVAHQKCLSLPRVIRISRHPHHRIYFTSSFDKGDWFCGVCRAKMDNDYGGYSCIKDDCSYVAHSKCATQRNVWDGKELEGVQEEIEEVDEPFVRISDGIIQHFSHQQHYLRLDEYTERDYDESKLCQACITPIYFGNFYSCMECEFIIHEKCANFSRKLYTPIHPHLLTLVGGNDSDSVVEYNVASCSVCYLKCIGGHFYKCGIEECRRSFKLHVQCATISEPLTHGSHIHPLFLTSKPYETRMCLVCKSTVETFNCVEGECVFSLCFECATRPQKVRYMHDKHIFTLSYGEETSSMTYWCEVCEGRVNPKGLFYTCDGNCCVTLHIKCLLGENLCMKPGSSFSIDYCEVRVLSNNQHMSRPFCSICKLHCPDKIVFQSSNLIYCSLRCFWEGRWSNR